MIKIKQYNVTALYLNAINKGIENITSRICWSKDEVLDYMKLLTEPQNPTAIQFEDGKTIPLKLEFAIDEYETSINLI